MRGFPRLHRRGRVGSREIGTKLHRLPRVESPGGSAGANRHPARGYGGRLLGFLRAALPAVAVIMSLIGTPARAVEAVDVRLDQPAIDLGDWGGRPTRGGRPRQG